MCTLQGIVDYTNLPSSQPVLGSMQRAQDPARSFHSSSGQVAGSRAVVGDAFVKQGTNHPMRTERPINRLLTVRLHTGLRSLWIDTR